MVRRTDERRRAVTCAFTRCSAAGTLGLRWFPFTRGSVQPIPLVRASTIRPIFDWIDRNGVAEPAELRDARKLVLQPTALVPAALGGRLFAAAERASGTSAFGLLSGAATPLLEIGDWGSVLSRVSSVSGCIHAIVQSSRRFNTGQRHWVVQRGDEVWLHHRLASCVVEGRDAAHAYALMLMLQMIRLATGPTWRATEIHLESARPPHAAQIEALVEKRVAYEQPYTAIVFPISVLHARFPQRLPHRAAERGALVPAEDFERSARQLVDALLDLGATDLHAAAESVHMSERSLQRRLTQSGLSFTQLVEQARFDKARRMLRGGTAKIVEISAELGYSDSANFTRAFRRWTGVAPQVFRRSPSLAATQVA